MNNADMETNGPAWRRKGLGIAAGLLLGTVSAAPLAAQGLEISYGFDLTSNYISKGLTQTDDDPAFQPYVGFSYNGLYLDFWASNASFGGISDTELDIGVGYRFSAGGMDLDIGFVQYLYREDDEDYGEAYIFGEYAFNDAATGEFKYYREVYNESDWFYAGGSYGGLPYGLSVSGGVGSDFGSKDYSQDLVEINLGLSKDIGEHAAIDARINDSSIEDTRFVLTFSVFN